jgi:hypothetical protein
VNRQSIVLGRSIWIAPIKPDYQALQDILWSKSEVQSKESFASLCFGTVYLIAVVLVVHQWFLVIAKRPETKECWLVGLRICD